MRLAFMGSPDFAVPTLNALIEAGHEIAAVYSQPDRPTGRGHKLKPTAVAERALALGLSVRTPKSLKNIEEQQSFAALELDAAIVVAYGLILPLPILEAPKYGCFNLHGSLLPRWRGAAPMQRAIEAGDTETGVQVMAMEEGLDTGAVFLSHTEIITEQTTAGQLHDALASAGAHLMISALEELEAGKLVGTPQKEDGVTYARKIERHETRLNWHLGAAAQVRKIHAFSPFPGCWFELPTDKGLVRIKALRAEFIEGAGQPGMVLDQDLAIACGEGAIRLLNVQKEGKGAASAAEFLRGNPVPIGTILP
jgi:methionyl-tRNA formyltransferase